MTTFDRLEQKIYGELHVHHTWLSSDEVAEFLSMRLGQTVNKARCAKTLERMYQLNLVAKTDEGKFGRLHPQTYGFSAHARSK